MTEQQVLTAVKNIIHVVTDEDVSNLDLNERLRDQLDLDSMDFLDIVMVLRKTYGVQVPEEDFKQLSSLRSCVCYLTPC